MSSPGRAEEKLVQVVNVKQETYVELHVVNRSPGVVTLTLGLSFNNARASTKSPFTWVYASGDTHAVNVWPSDRTRAWSFAMRYAWNFGDFRADPAKMPPYRPPFQRGEAYTITQGFGGSFSHQGEAHYAVDFRMPKGTRVCAARGGVVVRVTESFTESGTDESLKTKANIIDILHKDGFLTQYGHLKPNGALVKVGQSVRAGQVIGLSGNTGYTTNPHLHFMVFKPVDGYHSQSVPFVFRNAAGRQVEPAEGVAIAGW